MHPGPSTSSRMLRSFSTRLNTQPSRFPPDGSQVLDIAVCDASISGRWSTVRRRFRKYERSLTVSDVAASDAENALTADVLITTTANTRHEKQTAMSTPHLSASADSA